MVYRLIAAIGKILIGSVLFLFGIILVMLAYIVNRIGMVFTIASEDGNLAAEIAYYGIQFVLAMIFFLVLRLLLPLLSSMEMSIHELPLYIGGWLLGVLVRQKARRFLRHRRCSGESN